MAMDLDLVVRGGLIVDGSGGEPYRADIGVKDGRIQAIGRIADRGAEEIDAAGRIVTPGFVDVHTHYDGQVTWEAELLASSAHGVTTVVMGNCGVGFAPCRQGDRERLIALMEGVEDIPEVVMSTGISWDWETFPEYLDAVERRPHNIDVAAQLPHSALRVYVMGQRGCDREPPSPDDLERFEILTREALEAGALGFATSNLLLHRTRDGALIPSYGAPDDEYDAIARGLRAAGRGVVEIVTNPAEFGTQFRTIRRLAETSGRPVSYSLAQTLEAPRVWRQALAMTEQANADGLTIRAQVIGRPTGLLLGLDLSYNPFSLYPSYQALAKLPLAQKVAALRDPATRARILREAPNDSAFPILGYLKRFDWMFPLGDPPVYEPPVETNLANLAAAAGVRPEEVAYDLMLEDDGKALIFVPVANYIDGNLDVALEMLRHPHTILGLGDGGAHYGLISDSGYPTFMLSYWTRDREGERIELPSVVRALSAEPAAAVGLNDRGLLAVGYKADLNIIDHDHVRLRAPRIVRDLPANGARLLQAAEGFDATIVSGVVVSRDGRATGATPGRLVRGAQSAPAAG
jgi:N-acyl-D-aspartate/D-glutamate deacylase